MNIETEQLVEVLPMREQIANIMRKMILTGELKGGEMIRERQFSELFNVSTTPVKEAFRILQAEGLIYTKPRSGTFVSDISVETMLQIIYMRSALDGVAAYFAALLASDEDIAYLGVILDEIGNMIDQKASGDEISKKNAVFHEELRNLAQNDYLVTLIHNVNAIDAAFRSLALHKPVEHPRSHKEHVAIYEAIKNRNAVEAEHLMQEHIRRVANFVVNKEK